jgi:large subunit ribosomal protein L17
MGFNSTIRLIRRGRQAPGKAGQGFRKLLPSFRQWEVMKSNLNRLVINQKLELSLIYCKELQQYCEELIGLAKKYDSCRDPQERGRLNSLIESMIKQPETRSILFEELLQRYRDRPGLYTRVVNTYKFRDRDTVPIGIIEFVNRSDEIYPARPTTKELKKDLEMKSSEMTRRDKRKFKWLQSPPQISSTSN